MSTVDAPVSVITASVSRRTWPRCIALTTLLVGLSDFVQSYLLFSVVRHGRPIGVLQGPATGLLGRAAMTGGARTALVGTFLHFLIAFAWTLALALFYDRQPGLRARTPTAGGFLLFSALVGIIVWLTMNWVVLRFSRAHYYALSEPYFWLLLLGHIPFVGVPLVWGVTRLSPDASHTA